MHTIENLGNHRMEMLRELISETGMSVADLLNGLIDSAAESGVIKIIGAFHIKLKKDGSGILLAIDGFEPKTYGPAHLHDLIENLEKSVATKGRHQFIFAGETWILDETKSASTVHCNGYFEDKSVAWFSEHFATFFVSLLKVSIEDLKTMNKQPLNEDVDLIEDGSRPVH